MGLSTQVNPLLQTLAHWMNPPQPFLRPTTLEHLPEIHLYPFGQGHDLQVVLVVVAGLFTRNETSEELYVAYIRQHVEVEKKQQHKEQQH